MTRPTTPKTIGELLPSLLKATSEQHQLLRRLERRWRHAVGREVARHTKLVGFRRGTLCVQTDQPGVGFSVQLDKPRLLRCLSHPGERTVEDIVIRAGDV